MKPALYFLLLVSFFGCAPGTDPVYKRRELAGGGNEGSFVSVPSPLVPSDLGRAVGPNGELLGEERRCASSDAATSSDWASETVRVQLIDADQEKLRSKLAQIFPADETLGNDLAPLKATLESVVPDTRTASVVWLVSRSAGRYSYSARPEAKCDNYVFGLNVGAYLIIGMRIVFPDHKQANEFKKESGGPFSPSADPRRDAAISTRLREWEAKIEVSVAQLGGDPAPVKELSELGSRCSVEDLQSCRKLVSDLEHRFLEATKERPASLEATADKHPWALTGYVPLRSKEDLPLPEEALPEEVESE